MKSLITGIIGFGIGLYVGFTEQEKKKRKERPPYYNVSYYDYYTKARRYGKFPYKEPIRIASKVIEEVVLEDRKDAEEVLSRLTDMIVNYDVATIADFYDLVGINASFVDNKYGWYDLGAARVHRVKAGYSIFLPRPRAID